MIKKILFIYFFLGSMLYGQSLKEIVSKNDVIWDTPSKKSIESMLIGNGDIGINIWAEESGDIFFYIGKTDSWDEYSRLVKIGLIKLHISPNPFKEKFHQHLDLFNGQILIESGLNDNKLKLRIWIDANNPVINLDYESKIPYSYTLTPIIWRKSIREISGEERHSLYGFYDSKSKLYIYPDTLVKKDNNLFVYHRNEKSIWKEVLERQGMKKWSEQNEDPLLYRTYGYLLQGPIKNDCIEYLNSKKGSFKIYALTMVNKDIKEWQNRLLKIRESYINQKKEHYKKHVKFWNDFWNRSYVHIYGDTLAERISRLYNLQRFVFASAGRGEYPIKFNGSIFTVDSCDSKRNYDVDYRLWGGPYWNQNTRLIYYPLLLTGDFDLVQPFFNMYLNNLKYAKEKTKRLYNHEGAFFPETFYFWGSYAMDNFGWNTDIENFKYIENRYIRYHFQGALEVILMMLDYYYFTLNEDYFRNSIVPFAKEVITFYDKHFSVDEKGKLKMFPSQALETYWDIMNPTPDIAAFKVIVPKLLSFKKDMLGDEFYEFLLNFEKKIPEIPIGVKNNKNVILPCLSETTESSNSEVPELYPVFPYKIFGINKPDYELAVNTYKEAKNLSGICWQQGDVLAAYLGLMDSMIKHLKQRIELKHEKARFPIFWSSNFDWSPDEDHGGNLMITINAMLLQYENDNLFILPTFPKNWNVDFKYNLPGKTKLIFSYKDGKVKKIIFTPPTKKYKVKIF